MVIEQLTLNEPPGDGPVVILGELPELLEVARLFGYRQYRCWFVAACAIAQCARGKLACVTLTRTEATQLCVAARDSAFSELNLEELEPQPTPAAADTGYIAFDDDTTRVDVRTAILTFANTAPPERERL